MRMNVKREWLLVPTAMQTAIMIDHLISLTHVLALGVLYLRTVIEYSVLTRMSVMMMGTYVVNLKVAHVLIPSEAIDVNVIKGFK